MLWFLFSHEMEQNTNKLIKQTTQAFHRLPGAVTRSDKVGITVVSKIIGSPKLSPLNPIVNKSCNIELCFNKMHQIVPNMMASQYLQLKLNLL